jgi:hypothetical protein
MHSKLRSRLTFANVMSVIAVFIALGGTGAYALNEWNGSNIQDGTLTGADIKDLSIGLPDYGANSISTGKLKDQDVRTQDLRDLGVTNSKIAWDSVSSGKVINNNLTGDDVNESTLGRVPAADRAPIEGLQYGRRDVTLTPNCSGGCVLPFLLECPGVTKAIGGGYNHDFEGPGVRVVADGPVSSGDGWGVEFENTDAISHAASIYVVCGIGATP